VNTKNDINDKIDWSKAHAADGKQTGYSYIGVEGLSPHRYGPDHGSKSRGHISTDGRLVLWLGDNPDGSPNFGYFDAEELLARMQGREVVALAQGDLFKVVYNKTFTPIVKTYEVSSAHEAGRMFAGDTGAAPDVILVWEPDGMTWEQVWPVEVKE